MCLWYLQCTGSLANKLMKMDQAWPSDLTKNSQTAKNCKGRMLNDSLRRIPLTTKASCDICYQHLSATQTDDLTYAICYHSHRLANWIVDNPISWNINCAEKIVWCHNTFHVFTHLGLPTWCFLLISPNISRILRTKRPDTACTPPLHGSLGHEFEFLQDQPGVCERQSSAFFSLRLDSVSHRLHDSDLYWPPITRPPENWPLSSTIF